LASSRFRRGDLYSEVIEAFGDGSSKPRTDADTGNTQVPPDSGSSDSATPPLLRLEPEKSGLKAEDVKGQANKFAFDVKSQ
jgi:hypothetical protein